MTPLRQQMLDAMALKGHALRTQQTYLYVVSQLAQHFHRSPDRVSAAEIHAYFLYLLRERQLAPASLRVYVSAVQFLYTEVLHRPWVDCHVPYPKLPQRIPELLSRSEVQRLLGVSDDLGAMIGLDREWARRAIQASGNYGEIFAANIGEQTPIGLARGLNAQWTQGGLMYAPSFR